MELKKIALNDLDFKNSIFDKMKKDWMLVTAGTADNCNTMTASWGGLGVLWNKDVATIYVRPERYTYTYIERENYFSLAFLGEEYREALGLCGSKSGRDVDKVGACGFTVREAAQGGVFFAQADIVLICKKCYSQDMKTENMMGLNPGDYYGDVHGGVHTLFIGEIVEAYAR